MLGQRQVGWLRASLAPAPGRQRESRAGAATMCSAFRQIVRRQGITVLPFGSAVNLFVAAFSACGRVLRFDRL